MNNIFLIGRSPSDIPLHVSMYAEKVIREFLKNGAVHMEYARFGGLADVINAMPPEDRGIKKVGSLSIISHPLILSDFFHYAGASDKTWVHDNHKRYLPSQRLDCQPIDENVKGSILGSAVEELNKIAPELKAKFYLLGYNWFFVGKKNYENINTILLSNHSTIAKSCVARKWRLFYAPEEIREDKYVKYNTAKLDGSTLERAKNSPNTLFFANEPEPVDFRILLDNPLPYNIIIPESCKGSLELVESANEV